MKNSSGLHKIKNFFKKGDIILLIIFITALIVSVVLVARKGADTVNIYIDGKLSYRLSLSNEQKIEILDGKMTVKIEGGKVWIAKSDCYEQKCVQSAPLTSRGGMIICLPYKVVIEVVSNKVDAVT